jgi:rubrerythrin
MKFENLKDIIAFALQKEGEAAAFYEHLSKEETMAGAREMLQEFAQEEKKHQEYLQNFNSDNVQGKTAGYDIDWIPDLKRSDYLVDVEYRRGMGYRDILIVAMKREERALKLYNELLRAAVTENSKTLFKILCQEEAKHKRSFETMYDDYMAELGD